MATTGNCRIHDGDAVAFLDARGLQPGCDLGGQCADFAETHGLAHAGEARLAGIVCAGLFEQRADRLVSQRTDLGRYAFGIGFQPNPRCRDVAASRFNQCHSLLHSCRELPFRVVHRMRK
jgi:hypothetical protein